MHASILGVACATACTWALAATGVLPPATPATCPAATATVVERFISADCDACWTAAETATSSAHEWLLDWIVPSARGDDAPLSPAAPTEAAQRLQRALPADALAARGNVQRSAARAASGVQLRVTSGPAWNGYFGVQIDGRGRVATGASVWIALVESVAAGTDGTVVPRQLVRTLAGPYEPAELRGAKPWRLFQAMRWPETAKPERLRARAWIEQADGRIVAMASERC